MNLPRMGFCAGILLFVIVAGLAMPAVSSAEEYKTFTSEEYGFVMKYPATWVKVEPKGSYYLVFQAPDLVDNFRARIHVAAHKPVKDPISVFLQELRNGMADLQKKGSVKIVDEGDFKCDVPGAYFFFIQALDDKLKIWMDIVIVFYKKDQTLVRISCLAPSQSMERFQEMFNEVLVSVKFVDGQQPPAPATRPVPVPGPAPGTGQTVPPSPATQPNVRPAPPTPGALPATPQVKPAPALPGPAREAEPDAEEAPGVISPEQPTRQPAPAPRSGPRGGPLREPERPATGIVN
ncbi:MAG TPA: hypothetical protein VK463_06025 [Desulfomonilaceae bacterium]|nr:hypothetical protein [Desulfomonilaceae bacterium]